jgi:aspartyl-tRNA(Asn)/glutamyl-tRNA(Gln) amidotransferase subunit A
VAKALDVQDELQFPDAELARSAAFIISASEGGNQYLPALRREPERFEPHSRERLLAGAMIPSAWYIQAQRFRAHARQAFNAVCPGRRADRPGNAAQRHADRRANHGD